MGKLDALKKAKQQTSAAEPDTRDISEIISISGSGEEYESARRNIAIKNITFHESNVYNKLECGDDDISRLAEDIALNGLMHNLVVTQRPESKTFVLLSGERRLRALRQLYEKAKADNNTEDMAKYAFAACSVIKINAANDEERRKKEEIYLDAANLQARGSIGDSAVMQTVVVRYINNMQTVYGLSEADAKGLLKDLTGHKSDRLINKNVQLYKQLIPELYDFYAGGESDIDKANFVKISSMSADAQKSVLDILKYLEKSKKTLGDKYFDAAMFVRGRTADAAVLDDNEVMPQLDDIKQGLEDMVKATAAKAAEKTDAIAAAYTKRREQYIRSIEKSLAQVKKFSADTAVKQMRTLDAQAGKNDASIKAKLDELRAAVNALAAALEE